MLSCCYHRQPAHRAHRLFECLLVRKHLLVGAGLGLCLIHLVGCSGDPDRQRLVGDWQIAVADGLRHQLDPDDQQPIDTKPKMLIRFFYSGYLETRTTIGSVASAKKGRWTFLAYDPDSRTVQIECELRGETTAFDVIVEDANTIRLVPPNMAGLRGKIKFVRR